MGDTPAIAFGLLCLALGILFYRKRGKISKPAGGGATAGGPAPVGKGKFRIPAPVLYRIISGLMFFGGVGIASTFVGDWLRGWDWSIGTLSSRACIVIVAVLMFFALLIDVFDGNGLKPTTYAMLVIFPLMWATAGGSLAWPKALSSWAWARVTGAI
ncbi:hypothetical protein ABZW49_20200 [Nonomuraea wenchangensis]